MSFEYHYALVCSNHKEVYNDCLHTRRLQINASLQKVSGELSSQQITTVRRQIHQFIYDMNIFFKNCEFIIMMNDQKNLKSSGTHRLIGSLIAWVSNDFYYSTPDSCLISWTWLAFQIKITHRTSSLLNKKFNLLGKFFSLWEWTLIRAQYAVILAGDFNQYQCKQTGYE